jgi:hypothetical protein
VQRIVGRRLLVRRQGVAVGADIGGVPAGRRLASAGTAGEDAVGSQDHGVLRLLLSAGGAAARHDARCDTPSHLIESADSPDAFLKQSKGYVVLATAPQHLLRTTG